MYTFNLIDSINRNKKQHIIFDGPCGLIEGIAYNLKHTTNSNLALILPPDPTHKGTMNNKIVNILFDIFEEMGFSTLKINYRGVGLSYGPFKNSKEDKIIDSLHALDWLIKQCEKHKEKTPKIFVAGFSLGGWIALQCAMRRPEISNFITINSSFNTSEFNMLTPCPNGLIIQSTCDILTNVESSKKFISQIINQKGCSIDFKELNDDHYISSNQLILKEILKKYTNEMLIKTKLKNYK